MFRSLLRVNGVGPRVGLAVLSGMTAEEFFQCITEDDAAMLTRVPGIGRKTAERLIVELRDKVTSMDSNCTDRSFGRCIEYGVADARRGQCTRGSGL